MLVIYSKLAISTNDAGWIESIRRMHDPQHDLIAPHFTLVFPFASRAVDATIAHATRVAATTKPIQFRLTAAAAVKDPLGSKTHLFLLPTVGDEHIQKLHDDLYAGILSAYRHPDIPFLSHVTVGAFNHERDAAAAASQIGAVEIPGVLPSLCVANFDGRSVVNLSDIPFQAE